jgi:hypothetical protein
MKNIKDYNDFLNEEAPVTSTPPPTTATPAVVPSNKPSREDVAVMDDVYNKLAQLVESPTITSNSDLKGPLMQAIGIIDNCRHK